MPTQLERNCNFNVIVNIERGVGVHPPPPPSWADFTIYDGMYARNKPLSLCLYSVSTWTKY
jgi:hypothetical protein